MRYAALAAAVAAYLAAVAFLRPAPTPGPAMRDFEAYYAAGATQNAGGDAYGRAILRAEREVPGVSATREETLPFVNPPPELPLFDALARLTYARATIAWGALLALALLALLAASLACANATGDALACAAIVPLAVAFGPISSDLALGQAALVAAAGGACAAWAFARGRGGAGGVGAFFAGVFQPALAVPLLAGLRTWRALHALLAAGVTAALLWLALIALAHAPSFARYAMLLRAHGVAERFALIQFAPAAIAYGFGAGERAASAIGAAVALAAVLAWIAFVLRARPGTIGAFACACALAPFALPFFHEHDFTLLFLPCALALRRARGASGTAIALAATLLIAVDWLGLAQRPTGLAQSVLLAIAVAAAAFALRGRAERGAWIGVACVVAVFAIAAALALHHPAPIWPDAMRAFALSPRAPIAALWHAEQAASGMFAREPVWALLRCLPLLGCALLAPICARLGDGDAAAERNARHAGS